RLIEFSYKTIDRSSNYRATHSLNWWLDKQLFLLSNPSRFKIILKQMIHKCAIFLHHPKTLQISPWFLFGVVIIDSSGILTNLVGLKVIVTILKFLTPWLKFGCILLVSKSTLKSFCKRYI